MQSKLTLRIDKALVIKAKNISKKSKSLSKMVADYFKSLDSTYNADKYIPPLTKSLIGILKDKPIDEKDYKKHLEKKHL